MRIWLWFLVCAAALSAAAAIRTPDGVGGYWVAVQLACLAAAVTGIRRHRPSPALAYWLLVAGVAASSSTSVVRTFVPDVPEWVMAGYLPCYPLTAGALWLIAHRVRPWSTARLLDAIIALLGLAQLTWTFVLSPLLDRADAGGMETVGVTVIAVWALLVVALLLRVAFAVQVGVVAAMILASSLVMVLTDAGYLATYVWGADSTVMTPMTSIGWLAWSFLLAAAMLHPGIRRLGDSPRAAKEGRTPVAGFIGLALLGPAVLVADLTVHGGSGSWRHTLVPPLLTAALMVAMVLRLGRALRERTVLQEELTFRAEHDVLTGLANREEFRHRLQADLTARGSVGLLILDLDGFKDVNDTLGHPAGDELLRQAADRLRALGRPGDLIARLGGDEFAIVSTGAECVASLAEGCVTALAEPYLVDGRELRDPAFADEVLATLKRTGLPGAALVLEITETVLVTATGEETEAVSRRLARLRAHGIRIAIDDFGTGYSSLAYLRTLPIDVLKIDRSFVARVAERQDKALFRAVVELARSMHLQPVAEGVETEEQAAALREVDCGLAQGFLFARPMPAPALTGFLDQPALLPS